MKSIMMYMLAVITVSCSSQDSKSTNREEALLVYLSVRDNNYDIYKSDLDGNEMRLTTNPGFDYHPMWNETLEHLIYYSYVEDSFLIAGMDMGGTSIAVSTYGQSEFNLSPDGRHLIHQVQVGDYSALVLCKIDGSEPDTITNKDSYNGRAQWSWESNKLAYISDRDGNNEVYLFSLGDRSTTRLTNNDTFEKYIAWEPGGNRLAFTTQYFEEGKPDRNDVFIYDFESQSTKQITFNKFNDVEIAWSPLGDKIAFHSKRDSVDHIFVMNADGSNTQQITSAQAYHGEPEWAVIPNK